VEETCVFIALLDGTELPPLLPVRRLFADGEGKLGPSVISEGTFLWREDAGLLKKINEINDEFAIIIM
jgi:hypothetical protein